MNVEKLAELCLGIAALTAVSITIGFWGSWVIVALAWILMFPFAMLLGLGAGFLVRPSEEDDIEDAQMWTNDEDITITERSEEIVGLFQDETIHEWVMLKRPDNGELVRLKYERTIDMRNEFEFEAPRNTWFCILRPGIMYIADEHEPEPEN
jgi:hypothetical protein